jgi:hypothetical protein
MLKLKNLKYFPQSQNENNSSLYFKTLRGVLSGPLTGAKPPHDVTSPRNNALKDQQ